MRAISELFTETRLQGLAAPRNNVPSPACASGAAAAPQEKKSLILK